MEKLDKFERYIQINQKLLIEVKVGDYAGIFDSRIDDVEKDKLFLSMPTDKGNAVPLKPNTKLHISYVMENGRFSFKSMVIDRVKDPRPMLVVQYPDAVFRQELRSFFRVDTRMSIKILADMKTGDGIVSQQLFEAKVADMSGGGMRIFTDAKVEKNDIIEIYFLGNMDRLEQVKGQVMRSRRIEDKYELGIKFLELSQQDRDKVIKYVFKRQVEMRKLLG